MSPLDTDTRKRIRVLLVATPIVPIWQEELIRRIRTLNDRVELVIAVLPARYSLKARGRRQSLLDKVCAQVLDRRKVRHDAFPLITLDAESGDGGISSLDQLLRGGRGGWHLILNCTPIIDDSRLAEGTGIPVWGIRFGSSYNIVSPLATAPEVLTRVPITMLKIVVTNPGDSRLQMVYEASSSTVVTSARVNTCQLAWKAAECIPRLLLRLGYQSVRHEVVSGNGGIESILRSEQWPGIAEDISLRGIPGWLCSRFVNKLIKSIAKDQWLLATGSIDSPLEKPESLRLIKPPQDRFWADPHIVRHDGQHYVFFEELPYKLKRGRLCCVPLFVDGSIGEAVPVLDRDYHLSYPFVFAAGEELYMVPESAGHGSIELYRCLDFPNKWEYACDLMSGVEAYDTTLVQHGGFWWLFTNMAVVEGMSSWDQLHLYYASSFPTDRWTPHPANPIVDDVRIARPAGGLFFVGQRLFRPSQDSAGGYGSGINIMEVNELTTGKYRETLVKKWQPSHYLRGARGMHTFTFVDKTALFDLQVRRYRWQK